MHQPNFSLPLLRMLAPALCGLALAAPAEEASFYTPARDLQALQASAPEAGSENLPRVLLLGDSISIGYTPDVRRLLARQAHVLRPDANCGDTRAGLQHLEAWLGTQSWAVIHFNWGLHDLCYRNPEAKTQGFRDKVKGTLSVPPADYERNLEKLVTRLQRTGASLIWATTTKVPEGEIGRFVGDDAKYNEIAARVMARHGVAVDDLYAVSAALPDKLSAGPGNVHYTREGSALLARAVAAAIEKALPAHPAASSPTQEATP